MLTMPWPNLDGSMPTLLVLMLSNHLPQGDKDLSLTNLAVWLFPKIGEPTQNGW